MDIPWPERVAAISVNPEKAERADIARMAAELMYLRQELTAAQEMLTVAKDLMRCRENLRRLCEIDSKITEETKA